MRRIVFIGNCQAQALAEAFTQHIAPFTGDQARHIAATVDLNEAGRAALEGADVIVELVFDFAQRVSLGALGLTAPVIAVPYVNCQFLWPHAYEAHPHNAPTAFLDSGPYPIQLSDAYLNRLIREGVATEEAAARYLDLDINQHVRLDRRLEMGLALQRRRDEQTGFAVADLIARHFRDEPVFLTPDHPNRRIFLHIAQHCFERLGVPSHVIARLPHVMRRSLFLQDELPVHPRLAAHFGLTWASADRRYPFWLDGDFTFAEFIVRYLRYEWCEDFAAGHHLARLGERGAAIAQLRAGLAAHPAAGRAWALLSHVHAADGAVSAALAAAREAVALMPREAEFFAHLGNLLTQSDDPAGARAAYERAVALEPEHTPWLRLLAGHFERAGARAEAGALVANIAQKDSLDYVLHLQRGHFLAERGDPSGAASAFFHALGIAPHAKGIHAGLSHALAALGRREAAITEARAALVETPENHDLRLHLDNLLPESGGANAAAPKQEIVSISTDDKGAIMDKNTLSTIIQKLYRRFFGSRGLTSSKFGDSKCLIQEPLPRNLYLMTAHATFVGVDNDGNLTQLDWIKASAGRALCVTESEGKLIVQDDILRDFTLEIYQDGLSFKKNGKYLCALANSTAFAADRDLRLAWEIFHPTDERGFISYFDDLLITMPVESGHAHTGDSALVPVLSHLLERRRPENIIILGDDVKGMTKAANLLQEAVRASNRPIQICTELPGSETARGDHPLSLTAVPPEADTDSSAPEWIVAADASMLPKLIRSLSERNAFETSTQPEIMVLASDVDWHSTYWNDRVGYQRIVEPKTAIFWPSLMYLSNRSSSISMPYGMLVASARENGTLFLAEGHSLANARTASTITIFRPILEKLGRLKATELCYLLIQYGDDAHRDVVSVGYCRRRGLRNNVRLVPDPYFINSLGFETLRRAVLEDRLPPWDHRQDRVFWRGSATTNFQTVNGEPTERLEQVPRIAMCLALKGQPRVDAALMAPWLLDGRVATPGSDNVTDWLEEQGIFRPGEPMINHAKYRFLLDIDGVANAWGFFEKLLLGACVLKISSPFEQWFYSEISEWQHFVPVKHDMSDLIEKIEWCRQHEDEARAIAERGQRFALDHTYEVAMAAARDAVERSLIPGDVAERASGLSAAALKAALESAA